MNIKNGHFYTHITCSVEMLDDTTVEFVKSIILPHSQQMKTAGIQNQTEKFQSMNLLQQRTENVWSCITI